MTEMAMVSVRRARLQSQAESGSPGAQTALQILEEPNAFLSTVQIGITLIGTLAGALSGSSLSQHLEPYLAEIPPLQPYAETLSFALVVLAITYFSLILGELVPKQLALTYGEKIAIQAARPMNWLTRLMSPVVYLLSASTSLIVRLLRLKEPDEAPISEEEIKILLEAGAQAGVFEAVEHDIVKNVFEMTDLRVVELMTLRPEIIWLDVDAPIEENMRLMMDHHHALYPVYEGEMKDVVGIVAVKDLWAQICTREAPSLRRVMKPPLFVPESLATFEVVAQMREKNIWMALVIDEHGTIQGLITLTDILSAMMGDLAPDDGEETEAQIIQRKDGSWLVDGIVTVERFKEQFNLDLLDTPDHEKHSYQTLGGFIMTQLERIPQSSDQLEWRGVRFEVVDMDGRRVDKVLVTLPTPEAAPEPPPAPR